MNQSSVRTSGFRPKKRLGQHFLHDSNAIRKIISKAGFQSEDSVLEIGPGKGALTLPLAASVGKVIAVEKDTRLCIELRERLKKQDIGNVILVNQDILDWDFESGFSAKSRIKVIGNLPYNISTPFLGKLIENRTRVSRAVLMFQLEIAERLVAGPGNKTYGALSVRVQYHAHTTPLLKVSKNAFFPKPKVDSMVLELDFSRPHPRRVTDEAGFWRLVRGAFSHRRKTLLNSLKNYDPLLKPEKLLKAMDQCGINPARRAETLSIDEFICLSSAELTESRL